MGVKCSLYLRVFNVPELIPPKEAVRKRIKNVRNGEEDSNMTDSRKAISKAETEKDEPVKSFTEVLGEEYDADDLDDEPVKSFEETLKEIMGDQYECDDPYDGPFTVELMSVKIDDKEWEKTSR